jgi:hypothetical protein
MCQISYPWQYVSKNSFLPFEKTEGIWNNKSIADDDSHFEKLKKS